VVREVSRQEILDADIILCWRNATRHELNGLVRAHRGLDDGYAHAGEPVMGLRNAPEWGILNGEVYTLAQDHYSCDGSLHIIDRYGHEIEIERAFIDSFEPHIIERSDAEEDRVNPFAWAYACTVHKSQGSEWDRIIMVDEYNQEHRERWLYTGFTRASKSAIIQRSW
jgi:exodeoxyribonuclease-5